MRSGGSVCVRECVCCVCVDSVHPICVLVGVGVCLLCGHPCARLLVRAKRAVEDELAALQQAMATLRRDSQARAKAAADSIAHVCPA